MLKLAILPIIALGVVGQVPNKLKKIEEPKLDYKKDIAPIMKDLCLSCHTGKDAADNIDLSKYKTQADAIKDVKLWKKALREVESKAMPPKGAKQPTEAQKTKFKTWVKSLPKPKE